MTIDMPERIVNGRFDNWIGDNPDGWTVTGEVGNDPEISEAATGEAHVDTPTLGGGMCNLYTSDGTIVNITQTINLVIGRKYRLSINMDTITAGNIRINLGPAGADLTVFFSSTGIQTRSFISVTGANTLLEIKRKSIELTDVTFDDVSIKQCSI